MQKTKRYWLRGAVVAVIIHIILWIMLLCIIGLNPTNNKDLIGLVFPNVFLGIPVQILIGRLGIDQIFGSWTILWCLIPYWFVIGGLIGLIYGKIQNR